jgi:hypothetical protein
MKRSIKPRRLDNPPTKAPGRVTAPQLQPSDRASPRENDRCRYRSASGDLWDGDVLAVRDDGLVDIEVRGLVFKRRVWCASFSIPCGCAGPCAS